MGINLVWVCERHKKYHYSMRGEEDVDFQALIRVDGCPGTCFEFGDVIAMKDSHFDNRDYTEVWPNWDDRPAERVKKLNG